MRRMFRRNKVYLITNRTARGLPFVAHLYMNLLLLGLLARASYKYSGIAICAFLFMGNHFHLVVLLDADPVQLKDFMNYIDGEIAKIINKLTGVTNQNVWAGKFKPQELQTAEDVIDKITYCYLNPVAANLVKRIDHYPGISSWNRFLGKKLKSYRCITSGKLSKLSRNAFSGKMGCVLVRSIYKIEDTQKFPLLISPFAWKRCFKETRSLSDEDLRLEIILRVRSGEKNAARRRRKRQLEILGIRKLATQCIYQFYRPKKWGKARICISKCKLLRTQFMIEYNAFCAACEDAWKRWCNGDLDAKYPPGAFLPWQPPRASIWGSPT